MENQQFRLIITDPHKRMIRRRIGGTIAIAAFMYLWGFQEPGLQIAKGVLILSAAASSLLIPRDEMFNFGLKHDTSGNPLMILLGIAVGIVYLAVSFTPKFMYGFDWGRMLPWVIGVAFLSAGVELFVLYCRRVPEGAEGGEQKHDTQ